VSCGGGNPNFRLLDANVGWSAASAVNLVGLNDSTGICLAQMVAGALDPNQILPYLPPARLARGCGDCEWYLVTPAPPTSLVLHRDACHSDWRVWPGVEGSAPFQDAVAIAAWGDRVAVADCGANLVRVWARTGTRLLISINTPAPGPIAFSPRGELLVTSTANAQIARFGLGGESRGSLKAPLPTSGATQSIAVDGSDQVWIVEEKSGSFTLWSAAREAAQFQPGAIVDLRAAFSATGLTTASDAGFCFDQDTQRGLDVTTCFSWYGRPLDSESVIPPSPPQRQAQGQLLTLVLDSGVPRCEWHRVQLDADVPPKTSLSMGVATAEEPNAAAQGDPTRELGWTNFPAGTPHHSDWTSSPAGSVDFLIDQPAGRYLYFRLRLTGDGVATPLVRRVRIDFPRVTSLDHMPDVYRQTPKAEDFSKRFLALFDSAIADVDTVIQRYAALLDPSGVPAQMLPWLGGFFAISFDPTWSEAKRRLILQNAPLLYSQRGTVQGLQLALQLVFGVTASIEELSSVGPWGSVAANPCVRQSVVCQPATATTRGRPARLRAVRLFGRNSARFYLDRSTLGKAPLRSYGNPDQDPFSDGAYRFQVLVPPMSDNLSQQIQRLTNLVQSQSPAHTVASIRVGGTGFLPGTWSAIGVDTAFVPLAAPVLGTSGNIRLSRMSVLWGQPGSRGFGTAVGRKSVVGRQTIAG
jgi:phage tail-like protein